MTSLATPTPTSPTAPPSTPARARRPLTPRDLLLASLLSLASALVTFDAWQSIFSLGYHKEELGYVLLAPIVIAWIAWTRRHRWAQSSPQHGWLGLVILALGWWLFAHGFLADPVLWRAGAVVTAVGAFVAASGSQALFRFFPAFAATVFLIPVDPMGRYKLAAPLQTATAQATQTLCDLLGMYVNRSGNMLSTNGVDVTIAEACNGMRMVITLFVVCYLVAFVVPMRTWLRALLLLASPAVAVAANVLRLVPTVWMFGHTSPESAERFHDAAGWVMTIVAFVLLLSLCRFIEWALTPPPPTADPRPAATATAAAVPAAGGSHA